MSDSRYDAFISYNHAADDHLAPVIERGLQRLAKPWYKQRAISIYRDASDTGLTPSLWGTVQRKLDESGWFILLACPESAKSPWVQQEVTHWFERKSLERVLLVLTGGELVWDKAAGRYSPTTTALSPTMAGRFDSEPLYLDLRWAKEGTIPTPTDGRFRADIARLASPIHGKPPDELEGEDFRLQRKARRLARAAIATVATLALVASIAAVIAVANQRRAEQRAREATARQVGLQALDMPASELDEALLLSVVASELDPDAGTDRYRASRTLLGRYSKLVALLPVGEAASDVSVRSVAVSPEGDRVAATVQSVGGGARVVTWDLAGDGDPQPAPLTSGMATEVGFGGDGRVVVGAAGERLMVMSDGEATFADGEAILVDVDSANDRALIAGADQLALVDLSDGSVVASWPLGDDPPVGAMSGGRAVVAAGPSLHLVDSGTGDEVSSVELDGTPVALDVLDGTVALISHDGVVYVWTAGRRTPSTSVDGIASNPRQVALGDDGTRLVIVGDDGTTVFDPGGMEPVAFGSGAGPVTIDPTGRFAAVGGTSLTVWDLATNQRTVSVPEKANALAWSACTGEGPCRLAVAGEAIDVWDVETGRRTRLADQTNAQSVAITDDGTKVVSGGWGSTIAVWTLEVQVDDSLRAQLTFEGAPAAKDPVSGDFAVVTEPGSVEVTLVDRRVTIPTGPVEWMRIDGGAHRLVTVDGSTVRLFDTESAAEVPIDRRCVGDLVAVSPGGGLVVTHLASGRSTAVCSTETGAVVAGGRLQSVALPAEAIAVDDSGAVALGGSGFVDYYERDGETFAIGSAVDVRFGREPVAITAIAVNAGRLAVGVRSAVDDTAAARVVLWSASTGGAAVQFDTDHTAIAAVALIGDDADVVAVAGRSEVGGDVIVQTWEADTLRPLGRGLGGLVGDVVFLSGDEGMVIGTDASGQTFAWLFDRDPRREVCEIVGRPLTHDEWESAAGGVLGRYDYVAVCE